MTVAAQNEFYRVFLAYREGIVRRTLLLRSGTENAEPALRLPRELDFNQLLNSACLGLSSPRERLACRNAGSFASRGFLAARAGEMDVAQTHFATSWELWDRLEEGFCRTWLVGVIEGYQAYLEYRLRRRNEARARIERALDAALLLEDRYGLTLFELHRMQLGHNLARIDWRLGFLLEAFGLAGALVGHLQALRRDLPFHRDWHTARMLGCPSYLRRTMVLQVTLEAIDLLVAHPEPAHWDAFLREARIGDGQTSRLFGDPRLYHWLCARRARSLGDWQQYLGALEEILRPGPIGLGATYYSILVDFAHFCSADHSIAARKVLDFFSRDAPKWKGVPVLLAERLAEICGASPAPSRGLALLHGSEQGPNLRSAPTQTRPS